MNAMNEQSLSRLYRRLVAHRAPTPSAPRVDSGAPQDVAGSAHEDALARELARAPEGAAIASLLRELQALEARLAETAVPRRGMDLRLYGIGAQILRDLGVRRMRLMAAPRKIPSMAGFGLEVTGYAELPRR